MKTLIITLSRNLIYFLSVLVTIGFATSCSKSDISELETKEFSFDLQSKIPYGEIKKTEIPGTDKNLPREMLEFADMDAVRLTIEELEKQMEELDEAFLDFYSDLSADALRAKEEELNYRKEIPLLEFADFFAHHSLFKKIDDEMEDWLKNPELAFDTNPDNHFVPDEPNRAILNACSEIKIGDNFYKITPYGYFEIDGNQPGILDLFDNWIDYGTIITMPGVSFFGDLPDSSPPPGGGSNPPPGNILPSDTICSGNVSKNKTVSYANSRVYGKVWILTLPWLRRVGAKTVNYQMKSNGKWGKARAYTFVRVKGHISGADGNCNSMVNFNPSNTGFYKNNTKSHKMRINVSTRTKKIWLKSDHLGIGGIQFSID